VKRQRAIAKYCSIVVWISLTAGLALPVSANEAQQRLAHGAALRAAGRPQEGLAWVDHAIQLNPQLVEAHLERARIYFELGHLEHAVASASDAIRLNPLAAEPYYMRGKLWWKQHQLDRADADFSEAIDRQADNYAAYVCRGAVRLALDNVDGAQQDAEQAMQLDAEQAQSWVLRGRVRAAIGDHPGAETDFDAALRLQHDHFEALLERSESRLALRDLAGALEDAALACHRASGNPDPFTLRGRIWLEAQDAVRAEADFSRAMELSGSAIPAELFLQRAVARLLARRDAEAAADAAQCLQLAPHWKSRMATAWSDALRRRDQ
jgi:tetratricopeptide (TPR) repeat protein